jgi:hypothetical protein
MVFDYCKTYILKKQTTYKDISGKRLDPNHSKKAGLTPVESLFSGMAAGATSAVCTYPLDLARAQLAVLRGVKKKKDNVKTTIDKVVESVPKKRKGLGYVWSKSFQQGVCVCLLSLACNEIALTHKINNIMDSLLFLQGFRGLYRGITPTLLGILPYSGIAFTINEQGKRQVSFMSYLHTRYLCSETKLITCPFRYPIYSIENQPRWKKCYAVLFLVSLPKH